MYTKEQVFNSMLTGYNNKQIFPLKKAIAKNVLSYIYEAAELYISAALLHESTNIVSIPNPHSGQATFTATGAAVWINIFKTEALIAASVF